MYSNLSSISTYLKDIPAGQVFVLTDTNTATHCLPLLAPFIGDTPYHLLTLTAGESSKNIHSVQVVWEFLLKNHATREALLINLGGGMVTDLGGFAAATYMRGIRFVNIPTTLLAMVDASSGGKTGFDHMGVKNVIGCFAPPIITLIHTDFLLTLSERELLSGLAEMLKHALIDSKDEWYRLLQVLEEEPTKDQLVRYLSESGALERSMAIKDKIVEQDPREQGLRKVLNFGHTVGHAIESASLEQTMLHHSTPRYTNLHHPSHGYCVLWGMVAELYLSVVHAACTSHVLQQLVQVMLRYYGRPECDCKQREQLIARMYHDKKNSANQAPNFTLLKQVGQPVVNQYLSEKDIDEALEYLMSI